MKTLFREFYSIDEDTIRAIWDDCTFVLDTNVLLNLYRFPKKSQSDVLNVIEKLSSRTWIPHQVALEYQRNRPVVIAGQLNNFYKVKKAVTESINSLEGKFNEFEIKRNRNVIDTVSFIERIRACAADFEKELDVLKQQRQDVHEHDPIREKIDQIFANNVGGPMTEEEIKLLHKEGADRFAIQTPPGFADSGKKDSYMYGRTKIDSKYGDLIVWKQIIKYAKENSIKNIVFVTDDDKEDWWWIVDSSGDKTLGVRPELRHEIFSEGGVENFYMYNSARFVGRGMEFLNIPVEAESINEIEEVVKEQNEKTDVLGLIEAGLSVVAKEIFMDKLYEAVNWARRNEDGYVGLNSFVKNVLGGLGYDYKSSYSMAHELHTKGVIILGSTYDNELQRPVATVNLPALGKIAL